MIKQVYVSLRISGRWFLSRRVWFLRGMLYALLFGSLAWWVTGVLAATAIGLLAAAAVECVCAEIRLKDVPVQQAPQPDPAARSSGAKLFRWLIGPKFAIPIAVMLIFLVVWPSVLAPLLRWQAAHPDVLSAAELEALNVLFLLAMFGGGIGALGFVSGHAQRKFASGAWGWPLARSAYCLLVGLACLLVVYAILVDCTAGGRVGYVDGCVDHAPGVSADDLDYDHQPIRRLRFYVGLVRSASGGDEELFARLTKTMSYVTYFGITIFGAFCLSLVFPPVRFFFARRARGRQHRREA